MFGPLLLAPLLRSIAGIYNGAMIPLKRKPNADAVSW